MYKARKVDQSVASKLDIDSEFWDAVEKSPRFVNIVNGERALYDTRVGIVWSDSYLYVHYWVEEPFISGTMLERDSLLFNENNVEIFVDGGDVYYELEVSANNVVYEVLFAWQDKFDETIARFPGLDPVAAQALTFGGNNDRDAATFWTGTHPRGLRWAYRNWDLEGLRTEVRLDGTINDHSDVDKGWRALIKLPWASMELLADGRPIPPLEGDIWRFQFARYERLPELAQNVGWAWTPVGDADNHVPEKFTPIEFSTKSITF